MTTHIMLDLETWGKRPGCDIRSIGAVVFDPVRGKVGQHTFYIATDNPLMGTYSEAHHTVDELNAIDGPYRRYALHRDPETVKQSDEAFDNPVDLRDGLVQFAEWFTRLAYPAIHIYTSPHFSPVENIKLWANDHVTILAESYHAVGLPVPWHYRAPRSIRTVVDLSGLTRDEYVTHNALDDAIAQAMTVCKCYERLGLVVR